MKTFINISIGLLMGVLLVLGIHDNNQCYRSTDLEIYTDKNIYYIKGLTVSSEASNVTLTFKNKKQLKDFISDVTSWDLYYN